MSCEEDPDRSAVNGAVPARRIPDGRHYLVTRNGHLFVPYTPAEVRATRDFPPTRTSR
jgi:hypothetical protein